MVSLKTGTFTVGVDAEAEGVTNFAGRKDDTPSSGEDNLRSGEDGRLIFEGACRGEIFLDFFMEACFPNKTLSGIFLFEAEEGAGTNRDEKVFFGQGEGD